MSIPIERFGKDHWSTFGYLETETEKPKNARLRGTGTPDFERMRVNSELHPQFAHRGTGRWKAEYGTKLAGWFEATTPEEKAARFEINHDDWSCLDDAEEAGLIENLGSGINRVYKFTDLGHEIANQLREHKRRGGHFAGFEPRLPASAKGKSDRH